MPDFIHAYDRMLLIRRFEEAVEQLFAEGRIMGTAHTCIGQEATAVGVAAALKPCDAITSTHRGHGHFLARGADPGRLMAELFGRANGYSRGRGGSQMMMDPSMGFYGANGITGASVAFAAGLALQSRHDPGRARGGRHLRRRRLEPGRGARDSQPGRAVAPAAARALREQRLRHVHAFPPQASASRAWRTGPPPTASRGVRVDGNDVEAVHDGVADLAARARRGEGPALLECRTYRLSGHSRGDPREYRTREEERAAWQREPLGAPGERFCARRAGSTMPGVAVRRAGAGEAAWRRPSASPRRARRRI
jgi:TPP-dependent pyruvate/acetoin dehydrogenase alpha subunit